MDTIRDDFNVFDSETISIPEVETSGVGGMMDNNIPDGNILVCNLECCVIIWWRVDVQVLNDLSVSFGSLVSFKLLEVGACVLRILIHASCFGIKFRCLDASEECHDSWGKEFHLLGL